MKICAIGNSHLAAIKTGWETARTEYPHVEIVFFGAQSADLRALKVCDGVLAPESDKLRHMISLTSRGLERIEPVYDRFLIIGCQLSFRWLVDGLNEGKSVSDAATILGNTQAIVLAQMVRKITDAPLGVMPVPYSSFNTAAEAYQWVGDEGELIALDPSYRAALRDLGDKHGFEPIFQPERTIRNSIHTKPKFGLGSERLQSKAGEHQDGRHMNARFGAIYLRFILDALATEPSN